MIEEIYIRDLGVIEQSRLEFSPGFTALTGETGAGKTMVLTALGLLLGDRADSAVVRAGQTQTYVEGRWSLSQTGPISDRLEELGTGLENGELIMNRSLTSEGRSRASINGRAAPVGMLGELSENLVVIHGQSDQIRLKSSVAQRQALDAFAGQELTAALTNYRIAYDSWTALKAQLQKLESQLVNREARIEELTDAISRIEAVNPVPGEPQTLINKIDLWNNIEALRISVSAAHAALSSDETDDAISLLGLARKQLDSAARYSEELSDLGAKLSAIETEAREVSGRLGSILVSLEGEVEADVEALQLRRAKLTDLQRRFGDSVEEILAFQNQAEAELHLLNQADDSVAQLRSEVDNALKQAVTKAAVLSQLRKIAADQLVEQVNGELHSLAMPGASLVVEIGNSELGPFGADQISIQLSSYPGAEPRPLGKGASGGELSRIMLAIEVVLAKGSSVPTFIFDEVDAGVGGAAAIEIGRRLAKLARHAQVIVVTHLAQVAAFADRQLTVEKSVSDSHTVSGVAMASGINRERELARMLSGLPDSSSALEHAIELLAMAEEFRQKI